MCDSFAFRAAQVSWLETAIDAANGRLEPLTSFVLPGGTEAAARLHIARASVRRAERAMTAMAATVATNPQALAYVNRLSDYLFVLARVANDDGRADIKWIPGANRYSGASQRLPPSLDRALCCMCEGKFR